LITGKDSSLPDSTDSLKPEPTLNLMPFGNKPKPSGEPNSLPNIKLLNYLLNSILKTLLKSSKHNLNEKRRLKTILKNF
jgi:hypothetical protein